MSYILRIYMFHLFSTYFNKTPLTEVSLLIFITKSKTVKYWKEIIEGFDVPTHVIGELKLPISMCQRAEISTIGQLDRMLIRAKRWGAKYLKQLFLNEWGIPPKKTGANMDAVGIIVHLIIPSYPTLFTKETLERAHGYGESWRAIEAAKAILTPPWWWSKEAKIGYLCVFITGFLSLPFIA